jgi:hypothetical protein
MKEKANPRCVKLVGLGRIRQRVSGEYFRVKSLLLSSRIPGKASGSLHCCVKMSLNREFDLVE